jgi:uncharacterized protein YacL
MALLIVRLLYAFVCIGATAAFCFSESSAAPQIVVAHQVPAFFVITTLALSILVVDVLLPRKRVEVISVIYFGLLIGILLAHLLNLALGPMFSSLGSDGKNFQAGITMLSLLILPYLCITFMMQTKDQFRLVIPYVEFQRELKGSRPMVLDSSALIDGRISDIIETHVVDAQLIVPQYILQEIQDIADSHDKVRRTRGRRGLDILKKLQQDPKVDVKVVETDSGKGKSVDQRLIETCKSFNGRLVTNDLNLNKLASIQGIQVINLNDVANALKPRFIPGEAVRIRVIKEGEGYNQGVGYLDDGTMVVVESGSKEVGNDVDTVVTSVLQNSAGRMLFCRLADAK